MLAIKISFFFLSYFFLLVPFLSLAQDIQSVGVPFVQNYAKATYNSGSRNWSIAKGPAGVMYFGNSDGLLSFNGTSWRLHHMPNKAIARAVAVDGSGRVYVGAFSEFGYWSHNDQGKLTYHSLIDLIPEAEAPVDEIWKIYVDKERVIFQSFSTIYIYEGGEIKVVRGPHTFLFLHQVGGRLFVEVLSHGLFEVKGTHLAYVEGSQVLGTSGVLSILPYKGNYLIATAKDGLFLYDSLGIRPWHNQANQFLKTNQLNNGTMVLDKYYAFGTILNGVIIMDEDGNVVQKINKSSGLQNNTVLSLYVDEQNDLWVGLNNGIDRIELNSPLYFYFDKIGQFGTVYTSIIHKGKIYLGTNQGLYYSEWQVGKEGLFQSFDFKLIAHSQGQVWELAMLDGQLLCGHNNGTYRVEGDKIYNISTVTGGWAVKKLPSNPNLLIQGTYTGLVFYKKDEVGNWVFSHQVSNFNEPARYVEQDDNGDLWVSHNYKGLYRLKLSNDLKAVTESRYYGKEQGLPTDYKINAFKINNQLVFTSGSGFYRYDAISDRFSSYEQLNNKLDEFASSYRIVGACDNSSYWFINNGKAILANLGAPGKLKTNASLSNILSGRTVKHFESISCISNSMYLISIDDGFVIYNTEATSQYTAVPPPKVLITEVENTTDKNTLLSENGGGGKMISIPYQVNNLRISFALPYYRQGDVTYQYFLKGYSQHWSDWSPEPQKDFTNLDHRRYEFIVRARVNGEVTEPAILHFTVLPPWYATVWARAFYLLMAVAVAFLIRYLYRLKLQRAELKIQQKLEKEKEAQLKQQQLEAQQKLVQLKNEQLEAELAGKSRELANSALNIVSKNELLQAIKEEVLQLNELVADTRSKDQFRKIKKIINEGMNDVQDWNTFESSFNEAHGDYFKRLKSKHAELTPNDLKLCAYLRMNMNSKEIASLLNITVRSVELRRYRLRKRLKLEHEENLTEYLLQL